MSQDTENVVCSDTSANETSDESTGSTPLDTSTTLVKDAIEDIQKVGAIWSDMGFGAAKAAMDAVSQTVGTVTGEATSPADEANGEAAEAAGDETAETAGNETEEAAADPNAPVEFVQGALKDAQRVGEIWTGMGFGQARSAMDAVSQTVNVGKSTMQRLRDLL